jgi:hypothetical protein
MLVDNVILPKNPKVINDPRCAEEKALQGVRDLMLLRGPKAISIATALSQPSITKEQPVLIPRRWTRNK